MLLVTVIMVFLTIFTATFAVGYNRQQKQAFSSRLRQIGQGQSPQHQSSQEELGASLGQRVFKPLLMGMADRLGSHTPQQTKDRIRKQLMMAGNPGNIQATEFIALKVILAGGLFLFGIIIGISFLVTLALGMIGYIFPDTYLRQLVNRRIREITLAVPDVLDLLTVSVEAGLGFDSAIAKVVEKTKGALAEEFQRMLQEIRMGKPRRDALRNLSTRTGVADLQGFVAAVIQADQLGVSIGRVLRIQSVEIRRKRRQRAQEEAMQAPIKMLFPLVIFVFPSLFIILLGPALLMFMQAF